MTLETATDEVAGVLCALNQGAKLLLKEDFGVFQTMHGSFLKSL